MQRNELTSISNLSPGDRFHKALDKNKEVWQYISCKNRRHDCKRDNDLYPSPFSGLTAVIFLRNSNN